MPYADPEKRREWARIRNARRYREDPEFRAQQHRYYLANKGKWAAHRLMHMYGINPNQMVKLFLKQQQACGICRSPTTGQKRGWHIDHDHVTGLIRGILCPSCNQMLGNARDDPERLEAGAAYLRKHAASKLAVDDRRNIA